MLTGENGNEFRYEVVLSDNCFYGGCFNSWNTYKGEKVIKLLNIKIDKIVKKSVFSAIAQIMEKYPTANNESIYATLIKLGYNTKYNNISSTKSLVLKEKKIKSLMGVK